jgi:hypothetical protein
MDVCALKFWFGTFLCNAKGLAAAISEGNYSKISRFFK